MFVPRLSSVISKGLSLAFSAKLRPYPSAVFLCLEGWLYILASGPGPSLATGEDVRRLLNLSGSAPGLEFNHQSDIQPRREGRQAYLYSTLTVPQVHNGPHPADPCRSMSPQRPGAARQSPGAAWLCHSRGALVYGMYQKGYQQRR